MFKFKSIASAVAAVFIVSTLVACDGAGSVHTIGRPQTAGSDRGIYVESKSRQEIIDSARERENYYREDELLEHERVFIVNQDTCPSAQDISSFDYVEAGFLPYSKSISERQLDIVLATINPECLPSLSSPLEYPAVEDSEQLLEDWVQFTEVIAVAGRDFEESRVQVVEKMLEYNRDKMDSLTEWEEGALILEDERDAIIEDRDSYRLLRDYSYALQMLGVVSGLSDGWYFIYLKDAHLSAEGPMEISTQTVHVDNKLENAEVTSSY